MDQKEKQAAYLCYVLGGVIFIVGIVLFIVFNNTNFTAKKTTGRVVGYYDITTVEGEEHTMVNILYTVDGETITSYLEVPKIEYQDYR